MVEGFVLRSGLATIVAVEQQTAVQHLASTAREQRYREQSRLSTAPKENRDPIPHTPTRLAVAPRGSAPKLNYSEIIFSAPENGRLPSRLGLSLSLGTSRHPRPFDEKFIIKESSSPALIHASLDGVCLIRMGWAVKRLLIPVAVRRLSHP